MHDNIDKDKIISLVIKQLNNFFDDININLIEENIDEALRRTIHCLKAYDNKYYFDENNDFIFNPYHTSTYTIFLYYLANTIFKTNSRNDIADKIYYLNKIMNSVDWYYGISLPEVFNVEHPIGCVLGKAHYSDKFFVYQGVTVGGGGVNNLNYPTFGENVLIYSNATVLGSTNIGNNVIISSGCYIKDEVIPDCSIVFGSSPNIIIKQKSYNDMNLILPKWK